MAVKDLQDRRAIFDQFLKCLDREENLIHYRMSWGLQWNVAIFAAAVALSQVTMGDIQIRDLALGIMFLMGIVASVLSFIAIRAAHQQSKYLIAQIETRLSIIGNDWTTSEFIRPYGDPRTAHPTARKVSAFFPLIFILLWGALLVYLVQGHLDLRIH